METGINYSAGNPRLPASKALTLALITSALFIRHAFSANWMYLGVVGIHPLLPQRDPSYDPNGIPELTKATGICHYLPGLVQQQLSVCQAHPKALNSISIGAKRGIGECQYQFRKERWNCSTTDANPEFPFGNVIKKGSRETAFIYAITSAGVVHAMTQACSSGNLTECSCDMSNQGMATPEGWKWGGCSDNLRFGVQFARQFIDAPEREIQKKKRSFRNLMNLHNNEAGRVAVDRMLKMQCRCHGVSGSCELKTCWRSLAKFSKIGDYLKNKYDSSVQVIQKRLKRRANSRGMKKPRRRKRSRWVRKLPVAKNDLVHIHRSPNYCKTDPKRGILGTEGRVCNKTSTGADSCSFLCCGRGFNTQVVRYVERCHCKFMWCCYVKCKTCITNVKVHTCK